MNIKFQNGFSRLKFEYNSYTINIALYNPRCLVLFLDLFTDTYIRLCGLMLERFSSIGSLHIACDAHIDYV